MTSNNEGGKVTFLWCTVIFGGLCEDTSRDYEEDPQRHTVFFHRERTEILSRKILSPARRETPLSSSGFCIKHATYILLRQLKIFNFFNF